MIINIKKCLSYAIIIFTASFIVTIQNGITEDNRFEIAGFDDPDEAPNFLINLQNNLKKNNKKEIANLILFPTFVFADGEKVVITKKVDLVEFFDIVFIDSVKEAILNEKPETLSVKSNGIMIGRGEVWFARIKEEGSTEWVTRITKINNSTYKIK